MATETIKISELPTGTPSTDDILVFVDRADGVTKRADQDEFPAAAGDVTGPASSTDNAIVRFNSTTGKLLQNSTVTLSDNGDLSGIRTETFGSSNDRSQMIFANPDGSGSSIFSYSGLGGYNSIEMVRNAKYDPTSADWIRFDVSKPVGELLVDQSGNFEYWTAPAGANPIANWEQQFGMSSTGSATFNVGANDADFTIKKNTSGNAYVYDAGADTHSFSGATSITGNLTATNLSGTNTGDEPSASTTVEGVVELATTAEINTGTDSTRAMPVDQFVASSRNVRYFDIYAIDKATDNAVGTNIAGSIECPFTGTITEIGAYVETAGVTGASVWDVNKNGTTIMTTNKLSIDSAEVSTRTAATAPALTTTAITVGDLITIDTDSLSTTKPKGLHVRIGIRLT